MTTPESSNEPPAGPEKPSTPGYAGGDPLSALHQIAAGSVPQAAGGDDDLSPSASGFVGMLAKGSLAEPDLPGPAPETALPPLARPNPHADAGAGSEYRAASSTSVIHEAREVHVPPPSPPPAPRTPTPAARAGRRMRRAPFWYKPAIPVMFTVSSILFIIGLWACGAVLVWYTGHDTYPVSQPPAYPLIGLEPARDPATYEEIVRVTPLFKTTSLIMLLSLPVGISMSIMAVIMSRQVAASRPRSPAADEQATA